MFCKVIRVMSLFGLLILLGMPVYAAESYGPICNLLDWGENRIVDGEVILHPVADLTPEGGRITDGLADGTLHRLEILLDPFLQWALKETGDTGRLCYSTNENRAGFTAWNVTVNSETLSLAEPPYTGDYPAPIFTAMLLSMGVVFLLVLIENRKK